jgi:hypothetical protein
MKKTIFVLVLSLSALLSSCQETQNEPQKPEKEVFGPVPGELQVLNACGKSGAAGKMREYLIDRGFDVVELGNAPNWNYPETLIALRNPYWKGAEKLAQVLNTENVIPLENPVRMVDATIFVGKDFEDLIYGNNSSGR